MARHVSACWIGVGLGERHEEGGRERREHDVGSMRRDRERRVE